MADSEVTVIIVAFNHAEFVLASLASVERQTLPPTKVIVCDDASSDGTADLIREWASRTALPHTTLMLGRENIGLTKTLNAALAHVDTPLVAYMSGDDLMLERRLETQVPMLVSSDDGVAFVYSDAYRIDEDGVILDESFSDSMAGWDPVDNSLAALIRHNWIPAPSVLIRTQAIRDLGGYDESLFFEDYDLWLRLASRFSFIHTPQPLVCFREVATSLGHTRFRDSDNGWQWAKVQTRAKHLGIDAVTDRLIVEMIRPVVITLLDRGAPAARLAPLFREIARVDRRPTSLFYAVVTTFRVAWLARAMRSREAKDA